MDFQSPEYLNWLKTLDEGDKVGVRKEIDGIIAIKKITEITPRRLIKLLGWKYNFKNGRNKSGWRLEPITDEFILEYTGVE